MSNGKSTLSRVFTVTCLSLLFVVASTLRAQDFQQLPLAKAAEEEEFVPGELLVKFRDNVSQAAIDQTVASRGCSIAGEAPFGAYMLLNVPEGQEQDLAKEFGSDPGCEWAAPNLLAYALGYDDDDDDDDNDNGDCEDLLDDLGEEAPNDPFFPFQTNLALINIQNAWDEEVGDDDVVLLVMDTGVAFENRPIPASELGNVLPSNTQYVQAPDLACTAFVPGFDFINNDPNANDDRFHGTFVTGVAAQSSNNNLGSAGVAPGIRIMPVKVLNQFGSGTLGSLINGINFATAQGVDVVNMSLGFSPIASLPVFDPIFIGLDNALQAAHDAGIVVVASSGNSGIGIVSRPALNPNVIAVGASNFDGSTLAFYSQFSTLEPGFGILPTPGLPGSIEIVAPTGDFSDLDGNGIPDAPIHQSFFTNDPDNFAFFIAIGTSFSAPQVAAAAALLISNDQRPSKDGAGVEAIRQILRNSAQDLGPTGFDLFFGAGQLDVAAALRAEEEDDDLDKSTVPITDLQSVPEMFALDQNYPNPFNPETKINYQLPEQSNVAIKVYNLTGQLVQSLVDEVKAAGVHTVVWDGRDASGLSVPSGTYFYRIDAKNFKRTRKMVLLK